MMEWIGRTEAVNLVKAMSYHTQTDTNKEDVKNLVMELGKVGVDAAAKEVAERCKFKKPRNFKNVQNKYKFVNDIAQ